MKKLINNIYIQAYKILMLINILSKLPNTIDLLYSWRERIKQLLCHFTNNSDSKLITEFVNKPDINEYHKIVEVSKILNTDSNKKILLVTHEYTRTGAPKVALQVALAIKKLYNKAPIIMGVKNGELREDFEKSGFKTLLFDSLLTEDNYETFVNKFDLIFISSCAWDFLKFSHLIKRPIIWYSHEQFSSKYDIKFIKKMFRKIKIEKIYCGSPLTEKCLEKILPQHPKELLLYGIDDVTLPQTKKANDKIKISIMASIEIRKGQLIVAQAIKRLPEAILKKAEFEFIGSCCYKPFKKYERKFKNMLRNYDNVKFFENMPIQELLQHVAACDVILCPSLNDPMPIVATYAFMFKRLAVISDAIGQALIAKDNENAVIFSSGNNKNLAEKLASIIVCFNNYKSIAENGRVIYDNYFAVSNFEDKLKEGLDKYLL